MIAIGMPLLLYGAAQIGAGRIGPFAMAAAASGTLLLVAFILHGNRTSRPLIDIALLKRAPFAAAVATSALTGASMYGGLLLLPLYLQHSLGQSLADAGLMLLMMGLGSAMALPFAGILTDRHGARAISLAGSLLLLIATMPFLLPTQWPIVPVAAILLLRGVGLATAQMPAMTAAYGAVRQSEMGDAATLINIAQRLGGASGVIAVVVLFGQSGTPHSAGYGSAFTLLAILAIASLATVALLAPNNRRLG